MDDAIKEILDKILKEITEIKADIKTLQTNSKTSNTKITVIGNRPQKMASVKGIDSNEDFTL
jgi:hypothetical protein